MWQSFAAIGLETAEISRWIKKEKKRKKQQQNIRAALRYRNGRPWSAYHRRLSAETAAVLGVLNDAIQAADEDKVTCRDISYHAGSLPGGP